MRALWGALLWTLFLLLSLSLHRREGKRRLAEYKGLCRLVAHIKHALAGAPEPQSQIFARFSDDALARAGFLSLLQRDGLLSALSSGVLHLDESEMSPFKEYAEGLGSRLYAEEKQRADALLHTVEEILKEKEASFPGRERLAGTLFFSGGMLLLLLLL